MALTFVNQVGAPAGLNQAAPSSFIPEDFVRWARDVLFDQAGYLRRRAPFSVFKLYNNATPPSEAYPSVVDEHAITTVMTINPLGERVTGLVVGTSNSSRMLLYNQNFQAKYSGSNIISTAVLDTLPQDCIYDCKQTSTGGMWLSFMDTYAAAESSNDYYQYFWYGGYGEEQTVSNVTFSTTGTGSSMTYSNTITGTFDTNTITSGMFVYLTISNVDYYVGTIKDVSSSTLTLMKNILRVSNHTNISASTTYRSSLSIKLKNVRPYIHTHGRGLITRTSNTAIVSGSVGTEGEGHFKAAGIAGSSTTGAHGWALYRASDYAWLGDVDPTASTNDSLTLDTTYSTSYTDYPMDAEEYIAIAYGSVPDTRVTSTTRNSSGDNAKFAGIFNATYAGYQWYGNGANVESRNRIVFSAYHDAEAVDLSSDAADSIIIPGMNEMRGMASSSAGLVVFLSNKTYIIRGNYRANFSLEELYPEGCLSSMSIIEYGGGVFWASKVGLLYFDGASVRNLTAENLGVYYTDSVKAYSPEIDRIYGFVHKDYLFMHFTAFNPTYNPIRYEPVYADGIETTPAISDFEAIDWDPDFTVEDFDPANNVPIYWDSELLYTDGAFSTALVPLWQGSAPYSYYWGDDTTQYVWGPSRSTDGMTFAIYLPTNAITTLSNAGFRGAAKIDSITGLRAIMAVNMIDDNDDVYARLIDVDSMITTNPNYLLSSDEARIEIPGKEAVDTTIGPDFYIQTRSFTVGDPVLRKWFRQLFLNLYLVDGAVRLDLVDNEDNDQVNIQKKKHNVWDYFGEKLYTWSDLETLIWPRKLSPNRSTWSNVEALNLNWYQTSDAQFERRKMKFSWRYPSLGFRLYQMNKFRPSNNQSAQRPHIVKIDSWNIGFKPMRQSRV